MSISKPQSSTGDGAGVEATRASPAVDIVEPEPDLYVRSAGNLLRVAVAAVSFIATILISAIFRGGIRGAERDVVLLAETVPGPVAQVLIAAGQLVALLGPLALVVFLLAMRRFRVVVMVPVAAIAAGVAMYAVSGALALEVVLPGSVGQLRGVSYPGARYLASVAAIVTVVGPWLPQRWRRVATWLLFLIAFTRIASGADIPYDVAIALVLGWLVGAVVLLIFGSPSRHPNGRAIVAALAQAHVPVVRLEYLDRGVRGTNVYLARDRSGARRFVKVFSSDQPDTDRIVQLYRWFRLRDATSERPFTDVRRSVEHEALLALAAAEREIPTGRLVALAEVDPAGMLLVFDYVDGPPLSGLGPDLVTDQLLRRVWGLVVALRSVRIAHRDLHLGHILLSPTGEPVLVDFGFAEIAARDTQLRADIAELLCSTAIEVGPERAAQAAVDVLGPEVIADALPRLQKLALSSHTRKAVSRHDDLLPQLQSAVQHATGVDDVRYEELARIAPRKVLGIVVFAVALYALLPQLADVNDLRAELAGINAAWIVPMVLAQCLTYVGAAIGLVGSVPDRVRFIPELSAQVAASFVDLLAPASIGGMALNTRFLQKRGVDPPVAVAGVGLNAVAGFVAHVVLLGVFLLWAGATSGQVAATNTASVRPPSAKLLLLVALGLVVLFALTAALPIGRRLVSKRLVPLIRDAAVGFAELARRPRKLVALFGGSTLVTLGFLLALDCAVRAFGGDVPFATLGVAYLLASTVALVAPTPGGVGPLEIALTAALAQLGMGADAGLSAVLLFRTMTFWLPVLPGWITFHILERRGDI
jgi:uncharacterized protein (TIRG00374 family)